MALNDREPLVGKVSRRKFVQTTAAGVAAAGIVANLPSLSCAADGGAAKADAAGVLPMRVLGATDVMLTSLMFGSHVQRIDKKQMDQKERDAHVRKGLEMGVRAFDIYEHSYHQWDEMAAILKPIRKDVVISLTITGNDPPAEIDKALKVFGTDHIDLYRVCFWKPKGKPVPPVAFKQYDALLAAKKAGKVRAVGIAEHSVHEFEDMMVKYNEMDFVFIPFNFRQNGLTEWKGLLPQFEARKMGIVVIKPFGKGGMLNPNVVERFAKDVKLGAEPTKGDVAAASVKWILSHPFITSVCASMYSPEEVATDVAAAREAGAGKAVGLRERRLIEAVRLAMNEVGPDVYPAGYKWLEAWRA